MRVLPMGLHAAIVEDPLPDPARWSVALRRLDVPGIVDVVPAAHTVLIRCRDDAALAGVLRQIDDLPVVGEDDTERIEEVVRIPVDYGGPDLAAVAAPAGMTDDEVVELHSGVIYDVAFCGFSPGFGYLRGLPDELHLPRRPQPRTRVPAGSVAIAAAYAAVYPSASPGGWHLLGRTEMVLFDPSRTRPALLQPGTKVRFEPR